MQIEYEATFTNVNKDDIRARLKKAGAKLVRPEFMQKRTVFNLPKGNEIPGAWLRVRDEGDKITMSLKIVNGDKIEDQKEVIVEVSDYNCAVEILEKIGAIKKAYQESLRELWVIDGVEITIDEWPFLEPFVEVEGDCEESVRKAAQKLGFDWHEAYFGAVDGLYERKYGVSFDIIDNQTPKIVFNMKNPFV